MVAVYLVLTANSAVGVNVAVLPLVLTVPATAGEMVNVVAPKEVATTASENVALMVASRATFTALLAGMVDVTVGGGTTAGHPQPASASVSGIANHLRMIISPFNCVTDR
jgi:hypothetical protein